jgi:hypothetical protein
VHRAPGWRRAARKITDDAHIPKEDGFIPTALSDDRFLRWNRQERRAKYLRKRGHTNPPKDGFIRRKVSL